MASTTIPLRLDENLIQRLDELAESLTRRAAGTKISRSAATRTAIERGLESLEAEVGKPARRRKK